MSYVALRFDTAAGDSDAWSDELLAEGALSVDVSDPLAGTADESPIYGEPGLPVAGSWAWSRVVALFAADADWRGALAAAAATLALPLPPHETAPVPEQDWVRSTQAQFGPIEIAPGFWIVPTWSPMPDAAALALRLDPGLAFGTGSHPTTRLCLEWLREHVRAGDAVLDYGCGSGILALAACKLGAARAVGVDVDPQALRASADNAAANDVTATFLAPEALAPGTFAVVAANILANPLIMLAPLLGPRVAPGGSIALSGILAEQAAAVIAAYAPWFTLGAWRERDGWVLLAGGRGA